MGGLVSLLGALGLFLTGAIDVRASPGETCLDWLVEQGTAGYSDFDAERDRNSRGRSFSCDAAIKASDALRLIEDFRYGFLYDSPAHIERSVGFPLNVRVWDGNSPPQIQRLSIASADEWIEFKKGRFSKTERALIACSNLDNLQVNRPWSGFAIGLGRIWFLPSEDGEHRVQEINVKPLDSELLLRMCLGGQARTKEVEEQDPGVRSKQIGQR